MRNHSYENDFDLHENKTAWRTHFHMKGFALRLVLKQRHERTRKWPIHISIRVVISRSPFPFVATHLAEVKGAVFRVTAVGASHGR